MNTVENFLAIDHDAKFIGKEFVGGVILNNKNRAMRERLGLTPAVIERIRKCMLMQMGTGCFKNFCYGWHYLLLFFNVEETFLGVAPAITTLAYFIALSNLHIRARGRPSTDSTIPEMACEVIVTEDDSVKVTPAPAYADDKCKLGTQ